MQVPMYRDENDQPLWIEIYVESLFGECVTGQMEFPDVRVIGVDLGAMVIGIMVSKSLDAIQDRLTGPVVNFCAKMPDVPGAEEYGEFWMDMSGKRMDKKPDWVVETLKDIDENESEPKVLYLGGNLRDDKLSEIDPGFNA